MANDKIVNPSDAEYAQNQSLTDFATGKAAMLMWQSAATSLKAHGMTPDQYGVAPVPSQTATPTGDAGVTSMVAGINLAVFKNTKHKDAALKFVKFMTSTPEQKILNATYGSLPPVNEAQTDPAFQTPDLKVLASRAPEVGRAAAAGGRREPVRDPGRHRHEGPVRRRRRRQARHDRIRQGRAEQGAAADARALRIGPPP